MVVWLLIGVALAGFCVIAPLRWAAATMLIVMPMSGTAAMMLGENPLLLPLVCSLGFLGRTAFSLLIPEFRMQFLALMRQDWPLLAFFAYCAVSAVMNPRIFAGQTYINPQAEPGYEILSPSQVQIPQVVYLGFGVLLYLAFRHAILRVGLRPLLNAFMIQAVAFGGLGLAQGLLGLVGVEIPLDWIVNNEGGSIMSLVYVQGGFVRISSVFLESSACASWAAGVLAFLYGVYINRIDTVRTFWVMMLLGVMMMLSTSSTAYAGLAALAGFAFVHAILDPARDRRERGIILIAVFGLMAGIGVVIALSADETGLLGKFRNMILDFTVNKTNSESAFERGFWAELSIRNAQETNFFGVGYGAARSSGVFHGLFGTVGVPGLALLAAWALPAIRNAFRIPRTGEEAVSAAGGFGLFVSLATLGVSGSDISMLNMFWVLGAIAKAPLAERRILLERRSALEGEFSDPDTIDVGKPAPA
ncbi:MAG: hypothetical protein GC189_12740 [Alphaproteobacteria bacterium]|nr:hypothetical protein [Alphaproteobacteria bacterium]